MSTPATAHDRAPSLGRQAVALAGFALLVAIAAGIGGLAAAGSQETYAQLELPPFAPPAWLFGPAWTVLYILIALAAWVVWRTAGWIRAHWVWVAQLALNAAWTPLFFGADLYWVALVEIVLMAALIATTAWLFWQRSRLGGLLMVPYLAWVLFATALNAGVAILN